MFGTFGEFLSKTSLLLFASGCRHFQTLAKSKKWDHVRVDTTVCWKGIPFVCVKVEPWNNVFSDDIKRLYIVLWHKTYSNLPVRLRNLEHLQIKHSYGGHTVNVGIFSGINSLTSLRSGTLVRGLEKLTRLKRLCYEFPLESNVKKLDIEELYNENRYFTERQVPLKLPKLKILSCYTNAFENYEDMTNLEVLQLYTRGERIDCDKIRSKCTSLKKLVVVGTGSYWGISEVVNVSDTSFSLKLGFQ